MHIPKTAGMSLQGLVRRRYKKPNQLQLIYSIAENKAGIKNTRELKTVMGHFRFGIHAQIDRPAQYFTFFRDPIEHVISNYYYSLEKTEKYENNPENDQGIVHFAKGAYGYNLQTRFASGINNLAEYGPERAVQKAKENLKNNFAFIGITEEFDAGILIMGKILNWKITLYDAKNKGIKRKTNPQPSAHELAELQQILAPDIELYNYAQAAFKKQKQAFKIGPAKLKWFAQKNRLFSALNPMYTQLKLALGMAKSNQK